MKDFVQDLQQEAIKIKWPSRSMVISFTVAVIIISGIVGYILGGFDWIFTMGVKYILSKPL